MNYNKSHVLITTGGWKPKGGMFIVTLFFVVFHCGITFSQNVGINTTGALPDVSALLDIDAAPANNKGLLIPRIMLTSVTDATTIPAPATSLLVYNTGSGGLLPAGYWYNSGTPASPVWVQLLSSGSPEMAWLLSGNTNTVPSTSPIGTAIGAGENYVGTRDARDFVIGTTNLERMRVTSGGNVGIGMTNPSTALHVKASSNPVRFEGLQSGTSSDSLVTINGNGVLQKIENDLPDASIGSASLILVARGGTDMNYGNGDWPNNQITDFTLSTVTDLKSAYDAGTGIFTVPEKGFYSFSYTIRFINDPTFDAFNGNSGECTTYLWVNNAHSVGTATQVVLRGRYIAGGIVTYELRGSGMLYLKKNDTVRLRFFTYGTDNMNSDPTNVFFDKSSSFLQIWQY